MEMKVPCWHLGNFWVLQIFTKWKRSFGVRFFSSRFSDGDPKSYKPQDSKYVFPMYIHLKQFLK